MTKQELLIKYYESIHDNDLSTIILEPKMDANQIWTSGWGHAIVDPLNKQFVKGASSKDRAYQLGTVTLEQANQNFIVDNGIFTNGVKNILDKFKIPFTDIQLGALVSFAYNNGTGPFTNTQTSIYKSLVAKDIKGLANNLCKYYYSGSKALAGLLARRYSERDMLLTGQLNIYVVDSKFQIIKIYKNVVDIQGLETPNRKIITE